MITTFTALLFAHVLADFVLQTNWMVAHKRRPLAMGGHGDAIQTLDQVIQNGGEYPVKARLEPWPKDGA